MCQTGTDHLDSTQPVTRLTFTTPTPPPASPRRAHDPAEFRGSPTEFREPRCPRQNASPIAAEFPRPLPQALAIAAAAGGIHALSAAGAFSAPRSCTGVCRWNFSECQETTFPRLSLAQPCKNPVSPRIDTRHRGPCESAWAAWVRSRFVCAIARCAGRACGCWAGSLPPSNG